MTPAEPRLRNYIRIRIIYSRVQASVPAGKGTRYTMGSSRTFLSKFSTRVQTPPRKSKTSDFPTHARVFVWTRRRRSRTIYQTTSPSSSSSSPSSSRYSSRETSLLRAEKTFMFMVGFIKTPKVRVVTATGWGGGRNGRKLFPITRNEALSFAPSFSVLFIESGENRCSN